MASADWLKLTSPHAAGMGKHLDPEKRLASEHSNRDIDKSKSHLNVTIGCETYGEALTAMRARVKEVDKLYPPLKKKKADERVIAEMIEIKCPAEIAGQGIEAVYGFFKGIYKLEQDFFGAENVHGGFVHLDEIHEYTDKDGIKRNSLPHIHTLVSCYCEWEEPVKVKGKRTGEVRQRHGINGKNFEKKPRYNQLNQKIDEYCLDHYGITYTKGKGKEAGHGKSVEELKASEKLHQIQAEQNKAQAKLAELEKILHEATADAKETKTVKGLFGGIKKVFKTEEELEHDKVIAGAKLVLQREAAVAKREAACDNREMDLATAISTARAEERQQAIERQRTEVEKARKEEQRKAEQERQQLQAERDRAVTAQANLQRQLNHESALSEGWEEVAEKFDALLEDIGVPPQLQKDANECREMMAALNEAQNRRGIGR